MVYARINALVETTMLATHKLRPIGSDPTVTGMSVALPRQGRLISGMASRATIPLRI
jgi:hypothetical protein